MRKINPTRELFKWGPIDGRLVYVDFFMIAFTSAGRKFYSWPDLIGYFAKGALIFIADYQKLRDNGEVNFKKYILNNKNFNKYHKEWNNNLSNFLDYQKIIDSEYLKKLNTNDLLRVFKKWSDYYVKFWTVGQLPELSNWGGEQMLKRELEKRAEAENFNYLFERLSAPEDLSFYQKTELELLKLRGIKNKKLLDKELDNYQKNHFWLLNSYHHTKILSKNYFKNELLAYSPLEAKAKIKELTNLANKTKKENTL